MALTQGQIDNPDVVNLRLEQGILERLASGQYDEAKARSQLSNLYTTMNFSDDDIFEMINTIIRTFFLGIPSSRIGKPEDIGEGDWLALWTTPPEGGEKDGVKDPIDYDFGDVGALEPVRDLTATRAGRQTLFDRAMAASQFSRFASPLVRGIQQRRFNPLSAQYLLEEASDQAQGVIGPAQYQDFQEFLGTNPSTYTPEQFQTAIGGTRPLFTTPVSDLSERQLAARKALETAGGMGYQGPARNIITQAAMSGVSPLFQRYIPGIVGRSIDAWRQKNPQAELFKHFMDKGYDRATGAYSSPF